MLSDQILLGTVLVIPTVVSHVPALVILSKWVESFEAVGGLILFGATTAFLIDVMKDFFSQS
jgi:hypothetical protein